MAFEETREQQQMYNYFRSCIYIFLIIEIVMNLPITADNRVTQFILDILARFKVFNSVSGCKVAELICICVVCIGTKAQKALKFNVKTMVIYPVLAGLTLVGMCFIFHGMNIGMSWFGFPANRILYALCSVVATMLASLNKGGGDKKGGSEAFFTNSAENFLAAIIYFFVNFHPVGFKNGKKLKRYVSLAEDLPGQPHPLCALLGRRYHAGASGTGRHRQVLQLQGG